MTETTSRHRFGNNNAPLLALPSGSILQFLCMTLPLLGVYLYFLYLAYDRVQVATNTNHPQYGQDRIRLQDILLTYLVSLVPLASLVTYMIWIVPKRHALSRRYALESISILGNVHYNEQYYVEDTNTATTTTTTNLRHKLAKLRAYLANGLTARNNYGYVVYDLEKVANHPACNYYDESSTTGSHYPKNKKWNSIMKNRKNKSLWMGTITKKVRVYHRYPREQVSILVLPEYPYSGQPQIDMEADWASFAKYVGLSTTGGEELLTQEEMDEVIEDPSRCRTRNSMNNNNISNRNDRMLEENGTTTSATLLLSRDRSRGIILIAIGWIIFLLLASLYVIRQIAAVDTYYIDEDVNFAWKAFWILGCGITPAVAGGGNWIRWKMYERWILKSGSKRKTNGDDAAIKERGVSTSISHSGGRRGGGGGDGDEIDYDDENRGGSYVQMN